MTQQSEYSFISRYRQMIDSFIDSMERLMSMKAQYVALDLGNVLTDADFVDDNAGITKAEFIAAVASIDAVQALLATGHNTNLYKLKH